MRFALLGDHPDGLGIVLALHHSGRHTLVTYSGPASGLEALRARGLTPRPVGDVEEVLADPAIEAVVVAGKRADRPAQLRRALQSERHVLCVHPADEKPDMAYEAALLQKDARVVLLPLLPEALHPGVARLAALRASLGTLQLLEMERWSETALDAPPVSLHALPGWDVVREVGGEVAEVQVFTDAEDLTSTRPVLVSGRFTNKGLFRMVFLPGRPSPRVRLAVLADRGQAELIFPDGWSGPARLTWTDPDGTARDESWDSWNPWPKIVETFESAVTPSSPHPLIHSSSHLLTPSRPQWQDAVRAQELDDAARRSWRYRRVSTLEYPEASEEVGFKGTMTLVGCAMLWVILFLVILSTWVPWFGWLIIPALVFFIGLQALRWIVPAPNGEPPSDANAK